MIYLREKWDHPFYTYVFSSRYVWVSNPYTFIEEDQIIENSGKQIANYVGQLKI
jgi:hypothetical protein